jgi:ArsR family transcriptional regulator
MIRIPISFNVLPLDSESYFDNHRNMEIKVAPVNEQKVSRYADMFSAMGAEPRLRILRLLLAAHPDGMVVNEIGDELEIANSTLSHHLDKLKNEDLIEVQREGTFLRYSANTKALAELLGFLYAECCTRNKAVEPQRITCCK